jgi:hypothetical protein
MPKLLKWKTHYEHESTDWHRFCTENSLPIGKLLASSSSSQNTVTSPTQWCAVACSDLELHAELIRLLEKQIELMELATCVRLMDAELSEYEARQKRISEVLEQLSSFGTAGPFS